MLTDKFEAEFGLRALIGPLVRKLLEDLLKRSLTHRVFTDAKLIFKGLNQTEEVPYRFGASWHSQFVVIIIVL